MLKTIQKSKVFVTLITIALLCCFFTVLSNWSVPADAATGERDLVVYYVEKDFNGTCLVREIHKTAHKAYDWFAVDEAIHGKSSTKSVVQVFNQNVWAKSIITVQGRTTVDFTGFPFKAGTTWQEKKLALQGIVNTLTENQAVKQVRFTVKGNTYFQSNYWQRDLSCVCTVSQNATVRLTNPTAWNWVSSPLIVKGETANMTGLVKVTLRTPAKKTLAIGYAWVSREKGDFNIKLQYQKTPREWVGYLEVQTFTANTWQEGPIKTIPVLLSR